MPKLRNVALIIDSSQPYDRKIVQGVAAYVREVGHWSIYLEESRHQKIPDLCRWSGDGIIADFDDSHVANALRRLKIPVVGIGGGYGGYDPKSGIPYFASNEAAIARLAAEHLLERTGGMGPSVQRHAAHAQRIGEALIVASPVTIKGHGKIMDAKLGHVRRPFDCFCFATSCLVARLLLLCKQ